MTGPAEEMDRIYRPQRAIYDLTRRPYLIGRVALIENLAPPERGHVLEIACGTAWNLVQAARLYPEARFYGLDVSPVMLETARRAVVRQGLQSRVTLALGDATFFDAGAAFGRSTFDRVIISYALSMIPDWRRAMDLALDAVASGGSLHVVDFGGFDDLPGIARKLILAWLARFSVTPRVTLGAETARLARSKGFVPTLVRLYRGYAVWAVLTHSAQADDPDGRQYVARPPEMSNTAPVVNEHVLRRDPGDQRGDFLHLHEAVLRDLGEHEVDVLLGDLVEDRRLDRRRRNGS